MKYSKEATETHLLSCQYKDCLQLVSVCLHTEGGKGALFCNKETCLNLDRIEKTLRRSMPQATMDFTIGLSQTLRKEQMLLVELRFYYKSPKNIGKQEILDKINHSKDLLAGSTIHPNYIFIFKENVCCQARSHFNRLFSGRKTPCLIMTEEELYEQFFKHKSGEQH